LANELNENQTGTPLLRSIQVSNVNFLIFGPEVIPQLGTIIGELCKTDIFLINLKGDDFQADNMEASLSNFSFEPPDPSIRASLKASDTWGFIFTRL